MLFNENPEYVITKNNKYKINTDYLVGIECMKIVDDNSISDFERSLAIIYKLFGDEGLKNTEDYEQLLNKAKIYLSCGKENNSNEESQPDMDFSEDFKYIKTSFISDYNLDLSKVNMHWWDFFDLLCGLSNNELGNCCILNRIRNIRNYDTKKIKDPKERERIEKLKEQFALSKNKKIKKFTTEEEKNIKEFLSLLEKR